MPQARVVVLVSGSGTLLQALLDADLPARVVAVGADRAGIAGLERADFTITRCATGFDG